MSFVSPIAKAMTQNKMCCPLSNAYGVLLYNGLPAAVPHATCWRGFGWIQMYPFTVAGGFGYNMTWRASVDKQFDKSACQCALMYKVQLCDSLLLRHVRLCQVCTHRWMVFTIILSHVVIARFDKPRLSIFSIRFRSLSVNCCYWVVWHLRGTSLASSIFPLLQSFAFYATHWARKLNHLHISTTITSSVNCLRLSTFFYGVVILFLISVYNCRVFRRFYSLPFRQQHESQPLKAADVGRW